MNLRIFTVALLASAIPITVLAGNAKVSLTKEDFISAKRITQDGDAVVNLKLSKSGKAKLKKLGKSTDQKKIKAEIAGIVSDVSIRDIIRGEGIELDMLNKAARTL